MMATSMCCLLRQNSPLIRRILYNQLRFTIHTKSSRHKAISVGILDTPGVEDKLTKTKHDEPNDYGEPDYAFQKIDPTFENAQESFKSKTNGELIRALLVFKLCSYKLLVKHNKTMLKYGRAVLGKTMFEKVMKASFYGQFVAGEDENRIKPTIQRMQHFGIKSILDYSVEKDLSRKQAQEKEQEACVSDAQPADLNNSGPNVHFRFHREFGDRRELVNMARTYFYEDEEACERNLQYFLQGIDAVSGATQGTGFAAVKLTALGRPQLLLQLSEVLTRMRRFYDILATGNWNDGTIRTRDFERHLKSYMLDKQERKRWLTLIDSTRDGVIDLLDWHNLLEVNISLAKVLRVPNIQTGRLEPLATAMTDEEEECMKMFLQRIDKVAKYGKEKDVRVMIDAEQTYFQTAINRLCMELMRKYNKEKAVIFNTYQCYLKDAFNMATTDLALAEREDFYFGAKLVRGAYMEQERKRAAMIGYEDPINPTYKSTTGMYEKVLDEMMRHIKANKLGKIAIMVATHNEETVRFTLKKMQEYGIRSTDRVICFGQLFGMCDQVSFSLGQAGYSVYKYVPYGPVEEVLPYLSRRAVENGSLLEKVNKETRMIRQELWRRFKTFQFSYDPIKECPTAVQINGAPPVAAKD